MTVIEKFERKTRWVVILTAVAMVIEIITGLATGSMALLADGIHMGSHVLAIGLSWIAYVIVRKGQNTVIIRLHQWPYTPYFRFVHNGTGYSEVYLTC